MTAALSVVPDVGSITYDMLREEYDRIQRANWSRFKHLKKSPAHYHHAMLEGEEDKVPYKLGRGVHCAVLEPERFASQFVTWTGKVRNGKVWDAFREKHKGLDILTKAELEECQTIAKAVRSNASATPYISGGKSEVTLQWIHVTSTGARIECKCRLDFVANVGVLVDLKGTRDASPDGFGKLVWNYDYLVQAAFYDDGFAAVTGQKLPYVFVAVENSAPHVVQVYRVSDEQLEFGRQEYRRLLEILAFCRADSKWPGYSDGELDLTLPRWAMPQGVEDDIADLDLVLPTQEEA